MLSFVSNQRFSKRDLDLGSQLILVETFEFLQQGIEMTTIYFKYINTDIAMRDSALIPRATNLKYMTQLYEKCHFKHHF